MLIIESYSTAGTCVLLPKAPSGTTTAKENRARCLGLNKNGSAHLDTTTQLTSHMSEEPVFTDRESRMLLECPNQELPIPYTYSSMWKSRTSELASKCSLHARNFVLYVLSLLTERPSGAMWTNTFDSVSDNLDVACYTIGNNGKIRREEAVVINQKNVGEVLCNVAAYKLRDDLRAKGRPRMRHAISFAH